MQQFLNNKKIITGIIIILLILIGFGFWSASNRRPNEYGDGASLVREDLLVFENMRDDLVQEGVDKYFDDFALAANKLRQSPDGFHLAAAMELGWVHYNVGNFEQAQNTWEYVNEQRPGNSLSFAALGNLHEKQFRNYELAEFYYQAALDRQENEVDYIRNLHNLYLNNYKTDTDLAEQVVLRGLEVVPDNEDLLALLASYYQDRGELDKAQDQWQRLLQVKPGDERALRELEKL